ncbi:MAG: cysteine synthase A [Lachnospiraceae bacterium]|nr:cysteine synthase A [Lachnospiraceae bacterium]MBR4816383.1 cysteine synthase A [Lachnospiraceae bacterium]
MKKVENVTELIGNTPLLRLNKYRKTKGLNADILAKLEWFSLAGSVKDRAAYYMIKDAEAKGVLKKGSVIIEPTSGNTGIGLAAVAAAKGYRVIIVMPDTMSIERRNILKGYGAEIVLTDGKGGMKAAIAKAKELAETIPHSFIPGQFTNGSNPKAHYETTGPEIWRDSDHHVDIFVAGVGTGGTISGAGKYLKEVNPDVKVIAVEPKDSPMLSEGLAGAHQLQGLGAGFIPYTLDTEIYDDVIAVTTEEALMAANTLAKTEGVLAGISSGAALFAAEKLALDPKNKDKVIVVLFPDNGDRYLSTRLFEEE